MPGEGAYLLSDYGGECGECDLLRFIGTLELAGGRPLLSYRRGASTVQYIWWVLMVAFSNKYMGICS